MGEMMNVNPKTGLPANLEDIVCKEVLLKPLPYEELIEIFQKKMWAKEAKSFDGLDILDLEEILDFFLDEYNFRFGDWDYDLLALLEMNEEYLDFTIKAKKDNLEPSLVVGHTILSDPFMYNNIDCLEHFESAILGANQNIVEWNKVCSRSRPMIYEKPPINDLKDLLLDEFWHKAVVEEFEDLYYDFNGDLDAFIDGYEFYPFHLLMSLRHTRMSFGKFHLDVEFKDLCEGQIIMEILLGFKNLNLKMSLVQQPFNCWYDCFLYGEVPVIIESILEEAVDSIVYWNQLLAERKGDKSGRVNRKTDRITGESR